MQGVLLDQFGVLHDGVKPYPHAVAAVKQMAEQGQKILILSNSSRRKLPLCKTANNIVGVLSTAAPE